MTPFSAFVSIEQGVKTEFGYNFGGHSLFNLFSCPENCYALCYAIYATTEGGDVNMAIFNRYVPDLRTSISASSAIGAPLQFDQLSMPGCVFLRPGDDLRFSYDSSDSGSFGSMTYLIVLMRAK